MISAGSASGRRSRNRRTCRATTGRCTDTALSRPRSSADRRGRGAFSVIHNSRRQLASSFAGP
jgi:hypothetical protein